MDKFLQTALIKNHVLTEKDVEGFCKSAKIQGLSLRELLLQKEIVTKDQILISLSQTFNLDVISLNDLGIEEYLIHKVPIKIASYYKFIPIKIENNILTIASSIPFNIKTQDEIRMHIGISINVVLADENDINEAFKRYYGFASETIDKIMAKGSVKTAVSSSDSGQWIEDLEKETEDPTVAHLVNQIILEAYKKRATDIHIEPYRDKVRFRYRIDGVLVDANLPNEVKHFLQSILSRIKILANLSITEKRLPQDGSAVVKTKDQNLDLRISTIPTPRGESMVIRILPTKMMLLSLERLGFSDDGVIKIRELIKKPHGIIFLTGPTGSGKTTTLYACLNELNGSDRKIITIEDPVEYEMEGITQVQVNPKLSFSFSTGLRSILRHDPDILMVGEVRDLETAEIAIRTALTGHLVFSTLHTNDAASGITRLIDMGLEPYLVASSVESFVAQRLVRVICPKCKELITSPPLGVREEIAHSLSLNNPDVINIYQGMGCDHCNQTGYYGRIAIYEILVLNDAIRSAILEKPRSEHIKSIARKEGLVTLRQNAWRAVMAGVTTLQEVMNVTVKDEELDKDTQKGIDSFTDTALVLSEGINSSEAPIEPSEVIYKNVSLEKQSAYDARIYTRASLNVVLTYRLVKADPNDPTTLIANGGRFSTRTTDLSAGGLRFLSREVVPEGALIAIKVQLGEGWKNVECLAKICRVKQDRISGLYHVGLYYVDMLSSDKLTIDQFVDKKNKDGTRELISQEF